MVCYNCIKIRGVHIQICIEYLKKDTQETGNSDWLQWREMDNEGDGSRENRYSSVQNIKKNLNEPCHKPIFFNHLAERKWTKLEETLFLKAERRV